MTRLAEIACEKRAIATEEYRIEIVENLRLAGRAAKNNVLELAVSQSRFPFFAESSVCPLLICLGKPFEVLCPQ